MLQFYKPNSKNTGHAIGFQFNSKDGALYAQFVKQVSWDANSKRGTFKDGVQFNLKFNATEIGAILNTIERGREVTLFHQSEKGNTSIDLKEYIAGEKGKDGFTISVKPRANEGEEKPLTFGFWFNAAEARTLKEYLQFVLQHFFAAAYSEDKKRRAEYAERKNSGEQRSEKVEKNDPLA